MTVQQAVNAALSTIGVLASGESPATEETTDGVQALNRLIAGWNDALKRSLAGSVIGDVYTFAPLAANYSSGSDNIALSAGWHDALVWNLAVRLAPMFGRAIDPALVAMADKAKAAITSLPPVNLP